MTLSTNSLASVLASRPAVRKSDPAIRKPCSTKWIAARVTRTPRAAQASRMVGSIAFSGSPIELLVDRQAICSKRIR
jgi:hypothetical protein